MTYHYTLTRKDLKNLGINPSNAKEYSIEQNGWFYDFTHMYEILETKYGQFKGEIVVNKNNLTDEMKLYIQKNCTCHEYY